MPVYEYECEECGAVTEKECHHTERFDAPSCCECGNPETHQIVSPSTFVLRGSGWANDGYSGSGGKKT